MTLQIFKFHKIHGRPSDNDAVFSPVFWLYKCKIFVNKIMSVDHVSNLCWIIVFHFNVTVSPWAERSSYNASVGPSLSRPALFWVWPPVVSFSFECELWVDTQWRNEFVKVQLGIMETLKSAMSVIWDAMGFSVLNCALQIWEHFKWAALKLKRTL